MSETCEHGVALAEECPPCEEGYREVLGLVDRALTAEYEGLGSPHGPGREGFRRWLWCDYTPSLRPRGLSNDDHRRLAILRRGASPPEETLLEFVDRLATDLEEADRDTGALRAALVPFALGAVSTEGLAAMRAGDPVALPHRADDYRGAVRAFCSGTAGRRLEGRLATLEAERVRTREAAHRAWSLLSDLIEETEGPGRLSEILDIAGRIDDALRDGLVDPRVLDEETRAGSD